MNIRGGRAPELHKHRPTATRARCAQQSMQFPSPNHPQTRAKAPRPQAAGDAGPVMEALPRDPRQPRLTVHAPAAAPQAHAPTLRC